jgi:hypothetical protein
MKSMFIVHGQPFWTRLINLEIKYVPTRRESWSKVSGVRVWIISRAHGHGNNKAYVFLKRWAAPGYAQHILIALAYISSRGGGYGIHTRGMGKLGLEKYEATSVLRLSAYLKVLLIPSQSS